MVCYYTNWSQYRPNEGRYVPENIDASLCTHIIYSFAKFENYELAAYEWNDESTDWMKGNYQKTMDLRVSNPTLKILLAVGGWNMGSTEFSIMANDDNLRRKFVATAVKFLKKHGFNGLGIIKTLYLSKS